LWVMQLSYVTVAKEFWAVQKEVAELIKGRILVGHALHNDLKVGGFNSFLYTPCVCSCVI
jgi:hypothetical protein